MQLSQFFKIMETYFDDKVPVDDSTHRKSNSTRLQIFMNALCAENGENDANSIYNLSEEMLRKIYSGREKLPVDVARYYKGRLSWETFDSFICELEEDAIQNLISDFNSAGEYIDENNYIEDILTVFGCILDSIIVGRDASTIRRAEFLSGNRVKIGSETISLAPELMPRKEVLEKERPYIDALLRVYAQDAKFGKITISDLRNMHPKYETHLQIQREFYFSAESVLHQIRDLFPDGLIEFNNIKDETFSGLRMTILKAYKNALERVDTTLEKVVDISFGRSYLGRPDVGLIGNSEKQGIVHILVNDGKIEWIKDYDTDIQ